jgi:hypothetical protein
MGNGKETRESSSAPTSFPGVSAGVRDFSQDQLLITNYQLPIISLPVASELRPVWAFSQLAITNYQLPRKLIIPMQPDLILPITNYPLPITANLAKHY